MRNLLASLVLVLSACNATAPAVQLPQPLYADGTTFSLPCQEHGAHTQTIQSHSVGIVYSVADDQGNVQEVPEFLITQVFQMLGVIPNEESGQQAPTDQVDSLDLPAGK
jgi:hypothetical protein